MEEIFLIGERVTTDFSKFIELLINTELWKGLDYSDNILKDLCRGLSIQIQNHNQSLDWEPNYHSRSHFKDVCIALSLLIQSQAAIANSPVTHSAPTISSEEAWILLFCAIGHDFGHNGSINASPFELEKKSVSQINHWLSTTNYPPTEINGLMNYVEQNYSDMAKLVNSIEGRIGFLERVQFTSPHSQILNISAIQQTHIRQLKSNHVHSD